MPTDPQPVTLAQVVHRAVVAVDPDGNEGLDDLLARFEDADEPLDSTAAARAEERIVEEAGALDPQAEDPAVQLAAAVATYLAYRRDEVDEDADSLLELAARAEFEGQPPEGVAGLLADRGISLS
jgi:hypothetical protein